MSRNGDQACLDQVREKNLVFTVTPGRSGTALLARLLDMLPETAGRHEPEPNFTLCLRLVQTNPEMAIKFLLAHKLPAIAAVAESGYVETSHLFCAGFYGPMLRLGLVPNLIVLRRAPREVALSMYKYGAIPGRSNDGLAHYLKPDDAGVMPLPHWTTHHDYQLCYWHCLEVERRQRLYADWARRVGARVYEVDMADLLDLERFWALAAAMNLVRRGPLPAERQAHRDIIAVNQNPRAASRAVDIDPGPMEAEVVDRISYYEPFLVQAVSEHYAARAHPVSAASGTS